MPKKKSNMSNTALMVIVVILCMIFMANSWVSNEIEETKKIVTPASPLSNPMTRKNALRNNSLANNASGISPTDAQSTSMNGVSKKKKRKKIIYEIPLDDVNLVQ